MTLLCPHPFLLPLSGEGKLEQKETKYHQCIDDKAFHSKAPSPVNGRRSG
jgi:hypothetical protein